VLEHLAELVVKPANESGGYGMLVGPHATAKEVAYFREIIQKDRATTSLSPLWQFNCTNLVQRQVGAASY